MYHVSRKMNNLFKGVRQAIIFQYRLAVFIAVASLLQLMVIPVAAAQDSLTCQLAVSQSDSHEKGGLSNGMQETSVNIGSSVAAKAGNSSTEGENQSEKVEFRLRPSVSSDSSAIQVRGTAKQIEVGPDGKTILVEGTVTKCPDGNNDVVIHADKFEIDPESGQGKAKNAKLKFKNIPILYLPVLYFPVDNRRRSGFLYPTVGYSSGHGLILDIPYYWNLAPNYDMTTVFRPMTRRGLQLDTEFRYLNRNSNAYIRYELLPNDKGSEGKTRNAALLDYSWHNSNQHFIKFKGSWVSDNDYLDDFPDVYGQPGKTYLSQRASVHHVSPNYLLSYGVLHHTALGRTNNLFNRLPWIRFNYSRSVNEFITLQAKSAIDRFHRSNETRSWRYNTSGALDLTFKRSYSTVNLRIGVKDIRYSPGDGVVNTNRKLFTTIPFYSVTGNLVLDQKVNNRNWFWSLEPKIKYLKIRPSAEGQEHLPVFDTDVANLDSFEHIFADNRYLGGDRFGDTEQIGAGISARLVDSRDYTTKLKINAGQIFYLKDRRATIEGEQPGTENRSDLFVGLDSGNENPLKWHGSFLWDDKENKLNKVFASIRRDFGEKKYSRLLYRKLRGEGEEVGSEIQWQFSRGWSTKLHNVYSTSAKRIVSANMHLQYESCCWTAAVRFGQYLKRNLDDEKYIFLNFQTDGRSTRKK